MIKSKSSYNATDGYDIDEVIERVVNRMMIEERINQNDVISINTTPTYYYERKQCYFRSVQVTIIYKTDN